MHCFFSAGLFFRDDSYYNIIYANLNAPLLNLSAHIIIASSISIISAKSFSVFIKLAIKVL